MDKELHILNVVTVIKWYTGTLCCTFKYLYIFVEVKYTGLVFFWCVCLFLYVLIFYTVKPQTFHYKPCIFRPFIYTYNFRNRWKSFSWCEVSDGEVAVWECGRAGRHGCVWRSLSWRLRLRFPDIPWKTSSWEKTKLGRVSESDAHARVCISHLNPWFLPCCARYCPNAAFTVCVLGKNPK